MKRFLGAVALLFLLALGVLWLAKAGPFAEAVVDPDLDDSASPGAVKQTPRMTEHDNGPSNSTTGPLKEFTPGKDPITLREAIITLIEDQEVASPFDGKIIEVLVELNQPVRRGQVLARLDDSQSLAKELAAQIKAESNETVDAAKAKYETSKQIVIDDQSAGTAVSRNDKMIHKFQMEQAFYEWKKAINERDIAKQELNSARTDREQHKITSNVNGVISRTYKKLGERVRPGEPVFKVANYNRLRVEGTIPAQQAPYIKVGMRCLVEPERLLEPLGELRGHTDDVTCLAVTPDRLLLASASEDQSVMLWHRGRRWDTLQDNVPLYAVAAGKPTKDEATGNTTYTFVTGGANGRVRLWFVTANAQGQRIAKKSVEVGDPEAHRGGKISAVAFSPDGTLFATGGDRALCIWKLEGEQAKYQYTVRESAIEPAHRGSVTTLRLSQEPNGDLYLVSAGTDRSLKRWKLEDDHAKLDYRMKDRAGDVPQLGISQDGQKCLFDAGDKLWIVDFNERDIVGTIDSGRPANFSKLALFSPSGQLVLTANAAGRLQLCTMPASPNAAAFFREAYAEGFRRNTLLALGVLGACASEDSLLMVPGAGQLRRTTQASAGTRGQHGRADAEPRRQHDFPRCTCELS